MNPHVEPNVVLRKTSMDSGFAYDTIEANERIALELISSNLSSFTTTFSDATDWDFDASHDEESSTPRTKKNHSNDLLSRIRVPRYFSIIPLASTLARARAGADADAETKEQSRDVARENSNTIVAEENDKASVEKSLSVICDGHGRTRAARKVLAQAGVLRHTGMRNLEETLSKSRVKENKKRERGEQKASVGQKSKGMKT